MAVMIRSDLRLALEAADAADAITMASYRSPHLEIDTKPDSSPVTEADRAAEQAIRSVLQEGRPADAIAGEEYGESGDAERRWIIDPIDATLNYMRGVPVWGTLIALADSEGVAVGVVSAPAIGHRWWAGRGLGSFRNGIPMHVSDVATLDAATLSINSLVTHEEFGYGPQVTALSRACARTRGFGDFLSFMFLADGAVDIVTEPVAKEWDLAPLDIIVTEAGGTFTDISGDHTIVGGNAVATNGILHATVLEALNR
jgi:histidinol-phosphatase